MRKPKPIRLTLEPCPDPEPGRLYPGRIKKVSANREAVCIAVENLDKTMAGCLHLTELPKNLYPGNKTHRFAKAAGLDVETLGAQIDLRECVGKLVQMHFLPVGDSYEIEFEKV